MSINCKKSSDECEPVCDFCLHFLFYRDINGFNIDGSGWCGLHRKEVDACSSCENYYCKNQWEKDMERISEVL